MESFQDESLQSLLNYNDNENDDDDDDDDDDDAIRNTGLPPVETVPLLLLRFTEKADEELVHLVQSRLQEEGFIIVENAHLGGARGDNNNNNNSAELEHDEEGGVIIGLTTTQKKLESEAQAIRLFKRNYENEIMEAVEMERRHLYCSDEDYRDDFGLFSPFERILLVMRMLEEITVLPTTSSSNHHKRKHHMKRNHGRNHHHHHHHNNHSSSNHHHSSSNNNHNNNNSRSSAPPVFSKLTRKLDQMNVSYRREMADIRLYNEAVRKQERENERKMRAAKKQRRGGFGLPSRSNSFIVHHHHPTQPLRYILQQSGLLDVVTPVHDVAMRKACWRRIRPLSLTLDHQSLDMIQQYYGTEIAFYFAWMTYLTQWLLFPGLIGLASYVFMWYRNDTVMSDEYTPFYGFVAFFWAVLFCRFWKRQECRLSHKWGVFISDYQKQKTFAVRPEFQGQLRKSPIAPGQLETYYPPWRRHWKYLISSLVTLALLIAAFWTMILSLNLQGYINPKNDPSRWKDPSDHPFYWPRLAKLAEAGQTFDKTDMIRGLIPTFLHVATIFTLNQLYRQVAILLTTWENHETELSFSNSLILKRFLFEAFDCYVALFYLAFYERDVEKLRSELVTVFNIDTFRRLALECGVPLVMQQWNKLRKQYHVGKNKKNDDAHHDSQQQRDQQRTTQQRRRTGHMPLGDQVEMDEYEQFDDYMEIVIQFGYVTLFASAYPLASLISVVANIIEIRSDCFKLTFLCQRPPVVRSDGLNMWNHLLQAIVWLSALTNCLIFGFTSGQLMEWMPAFYYYDSDHHLRLKQDKGWVLIFLIFGMERLLIYGALIVRAIIPDVPEDVTLELERKAFFLEQRSREYHWEKEEKQQEQDSQSSHGSSNLPTASINTPIARIPARNGSKRHWDLIRKEQRRTKGKVLQQQTSKNKAV